MSERIDLEGFDLEPADAPRKRDRRQTRKPGKIYTFYSFKGGVGRSMALANIAVLVAAQGKKVLIVDFDLEAPGLEHFFLRHDPGLADRLSSQPGVIDLLGPSPLDWTSLRTSVELDFESTPQGTEDRGTGPVPQLDLIHSGRASRPREAYTDQVQQLNWSDLYAEHDIGTRFGQLRAEWISRYDYVFIDSRTGVTDIGDLCTVVLPDHLVLLFVTNEQNLEGVASIYHRAVAEHRRLPFERSKLTVLPVLSRDEFYSENKLSREWRQRAADKLSDLFEDWLPEDLRPVDAFQKIFIPYFAVWSFGEALPVLDEPEAASNPSSINASYARIARLILHDLDWTSLDEIADPAEITSTRISQRREIEEERRRLEEEIGRQREQISRKGATARRNFWLSNFAIFLILAAAGFFGWGFFANQSLQPEIARLQEQSAALERERDIATQEAEDMRAQLEQAQAQLDARGTILAEARTELGKAEAELQSAQRTIDLLNQQIAEFRSQLETASAAQGEATALREQLAALRADLKAQNESVARLTSRADRCESSSRRLTAELSRVARANPLCRPVIDELRRLVNP
jgi:cellulose biosynthesis protein BcsQ/archaellum component FlaC